MLLEGYASTDVQLHTDVSMNYEDYVSFHKRQKLSEMVVKPLVAQSSAYYATTGLNEPFANN